MKVLKYLPFGALAAGLAALVLAYLQHKINLLLFFNSDALYLPSLYQDIVQRGGRLSQWFLTPAPYFFPDWPLYFAANGLFAQAWHAVAAYFVFQAVLLCGALYLLGRLLAPGAVASTSAAAVTLFIALLGAQGAYPYVYLLLSAYHVGEFLLSLLSLALLVQALRKDGPLPPTLPAGLFAAATLAVMSDKLYVLHHVLAVLAAFVLMRRRWQPVRRNLLVLAGALLAGCVAGALLHKLLVANPVGLPWKFTVKELARNARDIAALWGGLWQFSPLAATVTLGWYAALLALLPGTLRGRGWRIEERGTALLAVSSLASFGGLLLVMLLSRAPVTIRYFIPVFWLPLALAMPMLHAALPERARRALLPLAWLALLAALWQLVSLARGEPRAVQGAPYPEEVACIDRALRPYGAVHGIAGYWEASRITMLSQSGIRVAPVTATLEPNRWITTGRNFQSAYDFALVPRDAAAADQPEEAALRRLNGEPAAQAECGMLRVLVYPRAALKLP
ncbi:hypothetical protein [Massilia endophytica]|uniref:hypothetical protein n=1 Tax=Massilia endophytica TaxID=2899220 RepID=UPI001E5D66C4|nr:hypothetical protein [Massilia endophytica]UGQ45491.1 hypothetical protein LSQ66_17100 [Massilia endophytica]